MNSGKVEGESCACARSMCAPAPMRTLCRRWALAPDLLRASETPSTAVVAGRARCGHSVGSSRSDRIPAARRSHRTQIRRYLATVVHDVEEKAPRHGRRRPLDSRRTRACQPSAPPADSASAARSPRSACHRSRTALSSSRARAQAPTRLPRFSSASMIIFSSLTICHAISRAVRDFGSGR